MEFKEAIDWIRRFGFLYGNYYLCEEGKNYALLFFYTYFKQKYKKTHEGEEVRNDLFSGAIESMVAIENWSRDKTKEQVEALTFRIFNDYVAAYFKHSDFQVLDNEVFVWAKEISETIETDSGLVIDEHDIHIEIIKVLCFMVDYLRGICKSFNVDLDRISRKAECVFPTDKIVIFSQPIAANKIQPTKWQNFIIGKNKDAWVDLIITEMQNASKTHNARLMAAIIAALQQSGAIIDLSSKGKKKEFYKLLKKDFSHLNTFEAVYKPFRDGEKPVREDEITAILTKISCR